MPRLAGVERVVCVRVFDNERKINRKSKTVNVYESVTKRGVCVCHQGSARVRASAAEMFVIPERGACLDWDETGRKCYRGPKAP